jgi:hypothetical protein
LADEDLRRIPMTKSWFDMSGSTSSRLAAAPALATKPTNRHSAGTLPCCTP